MKKTQLECRQHFFQWNGLDYVFYKGSSFTIDFVLVLFRFCRQVGFAFIFYHFVHFMSFHVNSVH